MIVLIIGVNGFIANSLAKSFSEKGVNVYGTSSKGGNNKYCLKTFSLKFGDTLGELESIQPDWVIHCAYDEQASTDKNIDNVISWSSYFKNKGVSNQIFLSSISAITGNSSQYSVVKQNVEDWFIANRMTVIRPGLVVGNGGLFLRMVHKVRQFPVIPLVNGGEQKVKLVSINHLSSEIIQVVSQNKSNIALNLFYKEESTFIELLKSIAVYFNKKVLFISIPYFLIFNIVAILERMKLNLGVKSSNLKGLIENDVKIESHLNENLDLNNILKSSFEDKK